MQCPHCNTAFHEAWTEYTLMGKNAETSQWDIEYLNCPECHRLVARLKGWQEVDNTRAVDRQILIHPKSAIRPIPTEVTEPFRKDFEEACAVSELSPKASAALSRRLLQLIIRDKAEIKARSLEKEIEALVASNTLPIDLAEDLDALRNVGNIASHPMTNEHSGEIVDVEPHEAVWLLDIIEELLDFYFVRPALRAKKRDSVHSKLVGAGKPGLRSDAEADPS